MLKKLAESSIQEANSRPSAPVKLPILFARAGENTNPPPQRENARLLSTSSAARLQFPGEIIKASLRPDLAVVRATQDLLVTVPWEEGLEAANKRKCSKYADLAEECREAGWKAIYMCVYIYMCMFVSVICLVVSFCLRNNFP